MGIKNYLQHFKLGNFEKMVQRFTAPFFCSLIIAAVFVCHVRFNNGDGSAFDINDQAWWYDYFMSLIPSFFATVAASLLFETYAPAELTRLKHITNLGLVTIIAAYTHYILPFKDAQNETTFFEFVFWCFACVFVAHHNYKHDNLVFWHNTKSILVALLAAMFLSFVVLVGSACVFGAIDALFGTKIIEPMMFIVAFTVIFLGAPSLVMAQLPQAGAQPTALALQPAGIVTKALVIIQWLLTAVLLAYAARILVGWQLPKGRVVYQVGSYAVGGMLVYFLAYHAQATKFVATYIRHWPKVLLGLALLPLIAIWQRIAAHGITPNRLLVLYLLVAIVGFGVVALRPRWQNKRLHIMALGLLAIAFLAFFSPINAQRVAKNYFGYDASQNNLHKNNSKLYFNIDIVDPLSFYSEQNKTGITVRGYNYLVPVRLTNENKFEFQLNRILQPKLSFKLSEHSPFTLTITDTTTKETRSILLDDLINYKTILKNGTSYNSRRYIENPVSTAWELNQHSLRLDIVSLRGMQRLEKNSSSITSVMDLEFYLLIK